jgi:hypothetical protein
LGGSGCVGAKVGKDQIAQFVMCIAHQLKQSDYKKIPQLIAEAEFYVLNQMMYLVVAGGRSLESFIGNYPTEIRRKYNELSSSAKQFGGKFVKDMENKLKSGWGWHSYLPPESRGAMIKSIIEAANDKPTDDLRKSAAFSINELLSTTQSSRHLNKTLERITLSMGNQSDFNTGVQLINAITSGTSFENCVIGCESRLAEANPLMGRPFLRNDENEIRIAELPLHHPGYFT